jgi:L-ascorbate metabolism protein UlaG (beta-lactamase superfamily)
MLENLHWLGHAGFRLDAPKIIYFDPWKLSKASRSADIILVTHDHFDHLSVEDIKLISTKETVIVADRQSADKLKGKVPCKEIEAVSPGEEIGIGEIKIETTASYNIDKEFHTRASQKVGYILRVEGIRIYHAGDTDFIPEMKMLSCDVALLPVSGTYVMNADEAAQAALTIGPRLAIPMHYGDIIGSSRDAQRFRDLLKGKVEVKILEKEG